MVVRRMVFAGIIIMLTSIIISHGITHDDIQTYLDKSTSFVGVQGPRADGFDGDGIVIAVIDTGIDYTHPDLSGFGPDGKIIGGYNFIHGGQPPIDTTGHGTQVAGVIAADGKVVGIAPKAKLLAYKVSEDGEGVSSELIVRAIGRAVDDGADIINISLGVNKTNTRIERAVNSALEQGVFVVAAAGNDGPNSSSIGSPAINHGAITVGATYNNLESSLVATLQVDDKQYTVIPMHRTSKLDEPIRAEIMSAGYARTADLEDLSAGRQDSSCRKRQCGW